MAKRPSRKILEALADLAKALRQIDAPSMVATPEDLVIYKALAWRDRDRYDIEQLLTLHEERIDLDRVRTFVREFAEILGTPERIPEFERMLQKIRVPEA